MSQKTEKATPYKLKKAREKGQVSKSIELITCVILLTSTGIMAALWPSWLEEIKQIMSQLFYFNNHIHLNVDNAIKLQHTLSIKLLVMWAPLAGSCIITAILTTLIQTGFVWSVHPLVPDFKKLHISRGIKRLFSSKLLFDAAKCTLKMTLVMILISLSFKREMPRLINLIQVSPADYPASMMQLFSKLGLQLIVLLFIIAFIDKFYTKWTFAKENRMSKQDIKDEYRQREGDPKIKAKIKQLQKQLRQKTASLEKIKTADVVITNPTHLAVALQYKRGIMSAPKVVCKAQGELAQHVKKVAQQHGIPIIENKSFARALFATVDLNQWISREHFPVAAIIFREIYRQKGQWV